MSGIKDARKRQKKKKQKKQLRALICIVVPLFLCLLLFFGIRSILSKPDKQPPKETTQSVDDKEKVAKKPAKKENKENKKSDKTKSVNTPKPQVEKLKLDKETPKDSDQGISITISSMGDCTLGTDINFNPATSLNAYYNAQGADYFFQYVRPILEKDDLSIVNMEGTLTTEEQREAKTYAFKADPEYSKILSGSSVEAANLANNHSHDYGSKSYTDTIEFLESDNVATFGFERVKLIELKDIKIGLTGIYELADHLDRKEQVKENISALKKAGAQLIIVNFHWGNEREYVPNEIQKELAHLAIDKGADLVIGHHPHVLQGIEKYKDRYIAYSLGNFCFGGNSNPGDKDTMIFQQTFTLKEGKLEKTDDVNIIPCSLSTASGYNDYCPIPLDGDEKQRVLDKIEEYSNQIR